MVLKTVTSGFQFYKTLILTQISNVKFQKCPDKWKLLKENSREMLEEA